VSIVLSDRSFDDFGEPPLLSGAIGDVLAARAVADSLLLAARLVFPDLALSRLVLTAVLVHCAIVDGDGVRRGGLTAFLSNLCEVEFPGPSLSRSALQFVRYAAADLQALAPRDRRALLEGLKTIVTGSESLAISTGDKTEENHTQVIY
jgi:hypothetical protein